MPISPASRLMPTLRRVVLAEGVSDRTDGQLLGAFLADRDADAFAGLVRRHGPMVLGVCRRVIGDLSTADDAFQAVFLVLARRAAAIVPREQVGNWLYGVSYRTAIKARAVLARRRSREKQVEVMPEPPVSSPELWSDLQPVIDEELARLPDKLRLPVVLCDLEGRPQREVARHLKVAPATLATRLATARRMLAKRLTQRGVTLSGGALAGLLTAHGTVAAVSHTLAYGLAQAAEAVACGSIASSFVSPHAIQLSEGVIRMMLLTKLKTVAVAVVTVAILTGGFSLGLAPALAGDEPAQSQKPGAASTTGHAKAKPGAGQAANTVETQPYAVVLDDQSFLRRLILDLCGTVPSDLEMRYFIADPDTSKRAKVITWLTHDETILADLAKKLGVSPDQIRFIQVTTANEGKTLRIAISSDSEQKDQPARFYTLYRRQPIANSPAAEATYLLSSTTTAGENVRLWSAGNGTGAGNQVTQAFIIGQAATTETRVLGDLLNRVEVIQVDPLGAADPSWMDVIADRNIQVIVDLDSKVVSDAKFLKRVLHEARGTPPTALEEKYFAEDKDPKKREKLLDTLLKDPAVAKKLGDQWKQKMLENPYEARVRRLKVHSYFPQLQKPFVVPLNDYPAPRTAELNWIPGAVPGQSLQQWNPNQSSPPQPSRVEKLVGELLAAKKTDAEMLEAVSLATVGRLPTDAEKRLTLGLVTKSADRHAAWVEVAKDLASTEEGAKKGPTGPETIPLSPQKP